MTRLRSTVAAASAAVALLVLTGCEHEPDKVATRGGRPATTAASTASTPAAVVTTKPPSPTKPATRSASPTPARVSSPPRPATSSAPVRTKAAPSACSAPTNPWGYNFCGRGSMIYSPPSGFCSYFDCIDSFWESTNGHVAQCDDGLFSHSGGRRGACSHHGGVRRALYG